MTDVLGVYFLSGHSLYTTHTVGQESGSLVEKDRENICNVAAVTIFFHFIKRHFPTPAVRAC